MKHYRIRTIVNQDQIKVCTPQEALIYLTLATLIECDIVHRSEQQHYINPAQHKPPTNWGLAPKIDIDPRRGYTISYKLNTKISERRLMAYFSLHECHPSQVGYRFFCAPSI